jgi:adenylate cyclase
MKQNSLAAWLAEAGLRNLPVEEMVDGFARRLNEADVPVARIFVGTNTLHPMVRARSLVWDRATGPSTHFEFRHVEIDTPQVRQSPFATMLDEGIAERRCDLTRPAPPDDLPLFQELRTEGMTEWYGRVFPFGELAARVGGPEEVERASELWLVVSVTTDCAGGYSDPQMVMLRELLPLFAVAMKAATSLAVGQGLLAAYLGADPAARVFAGTVLRGEAQSVEAVLFYADLREFTSLADTLPGRELIHLLDECFDCMARPVTRRGGEILKFLGDGLLAIFRTDDRRRAETCASALAAASEALDLIDVLANARRNDGKATPGLDIALHVGSVQYGNVGTDGRLDFTVIGPAVNEAARIEHLCKELGRNLLVSQAFAAAAERSRRHLVSLGRHRLRGVREEAELFTLA